MTADERIRQLINENLALRAKLVALTPARKPHRASALTLLRAPKNSPPPVSFSPLVLAGRGDDGRRSAPNAPGGHIAGRAK